MLVTADADVSLCFWELDAALPRYSFDNGGDVAGADNIAVADDSNGCTANGLVGLSADELSSATFAGDLLFARLGDVDEQSIFFDE